MGYDALGAAYAQARANQLAEVATMVTTIQVRLVGVPSYQIDRYAVRQITSPASKLCDDTLALMMRLRPYVSPVVGSMIDEVTAVAGGHRAALQRLAG